MIRIQRDPANAMGLLLQTDTYLESKTLMDLLSTLPQHIKGTPAEGITLSLDEDVFKMFNMPNVH